MRARHEDHGGAPVTRHSRAFPALEPPPGGLFRLRARLRRPSRAARLAALAFVPSLAAAAVVLALVARAPAPPLPDHPSLVEAAAPVVVDGARAVAVPLEGGTTLYWVP